MRVLLIQKGVKLHTLGLYLFVQFESLVNTEGSKTSYSCSAVGILFESLVNTEGSKTREDFIDQMKEFESLVNTEGSKTAEKINLANACLRVLLIQKL